MLAHTILCLNGATILYSCVAALHTTRIMRISPLSLFTGLAAFICAMQEDILTSADEAACMLAILAMAGGFCSVAIEAIECWCE